MITQAEAIRRVTLDRELLSNEAAARSAAELGSDYRVDGDPLGEFCESLHDLVAHVLMWDEINLAVLTEARNSRTHWSLDARWETPAAGKLLNKAGVAAGREQPAELLLHRFETVRDALLDELATHSWDANLELDQETPHSKGSLATYVMTVPHQEPFWHAALHLGVRLDPSAH